jgi:EAL domain-containing protein (putative c-di-GMP-specific phosphodiesterase class I)
MNLAGDDLTGDNLAGDVVELATTLDAGHTLADVCASAGHPDTPLSVLVDSERLRQPGFAAEVGAALARSQRPADRLTIVVTAAGDLGGIDAALRDVRATGVRLGLHVAADTPTTLTAIMALELSRLTVDVSFLTQPDGDGATARRRTALAAGIARIAHEAGLECVAVGATDAVLVRTLGYSLAQGSPDEAGTLVALDRSADRQECRSGTTNAVVSA